MMTIPEFYAKYGEKALYQPGNKRYFLANDPTPRNLNSYGPNHFVLNKAGQVEEYLMTERRDRMSPEELALTERDELTPEEEARLTQLYDDRSGVRKWWGAPLVDYYIWAYFPDLRPVAYRLVQPLPTNSGVAQIGCWAELQDNDTASFYGIVYTAAAMNDMPQFFEPLYEYPEL